MNHMHDLVQIVRKNFSTARAMVDPAECEEGSWFLDVHLEEYWLNVEWDPKRGFLLTARDDVVFGEGADEVYPDLSGAVRRVLWLLEHKSRTAPPLEEAVSLARDAAVRQFGLSYGNGPRALRLAARPIPARQRCGPTMGFQGTHGSRGDALERGQRRGRHR
jgi:hypothetical protein